MKSNTNPYQSQVCERPKCKYRHFTRMLRNCLNQKFRSTLFNLLRMWGWKRYIPKSIRTMYKVSNTRLSTLFHRKKRVSKSHKALETVYTLHKYQKLKARAKKSEILPSEVQRCLGPQKHPNGLPSHTIFLNIRKIH